MIGTAWRIVVLVLLATLPGCASLLWIDPPAAIDEYAAVRVRVYRAGLTCRLEVITPTLTIQTYPTKCLAVPHRSDP